MNYYWIALFLLTVLSLFQLAIVTGLMFRSNEQDSKLQELHLRYVNLEKEHAVNKKLVESFLSVLSKNVDPNKGGSYPSTYSYPTRKGPSGTN